MKRSNNSATVDEQLATLQRIEVLLTVIAKRLFSDKLTEIMKDAQQRMIYEGAGRISSKELAKKARVSLTTVSGLWQEWERQGLMIKDGKSYRPVL